MANHGIEPLYLSLETYLMHIHGVGVDLTTLMDDLIRALAPADHGRERGRHGDLGPKAGGEIPAP